MVPAGRGFPIRYLGAVLAICLLGGCASSELPTPAPQVKNARGTPWTVVPLIVPDTTVSGYVRTSRHDTLRTKLSAVLTDAGQPNLMFSDPSSGGSLDLYHVYRGVSVDGRNKLVPDFAAVQSLRQIEDHRYVLAARATAWSRKTGRALKEVSAYTLALLFTEAADSDAFSEPYNFDDGTAVVLDLIDTGTGEVIGRGTARTKQGVDAAVRSAVLELLTGRTLAPQNFDVDTADDVIVYRYEKPTLIGTAFRVVEMEAVVDLQEGEVKRLPLHTVQTVKSTTKNRIIFPVGTE